MACLLKAPNRTRKGCVTFTTQERDNVINPSAEMRAEIERLKDRYVVGLHHNWHDHQFRYDPLFDFSMAGDGDLVETEGKDFARIPLDACNFAPPCYSLPRNEPFWDIFCVARAVNFKGIPEFFDAIRALYDSGHKPRVLFICALPEIVEIPGIADLRQHFENLFSPVERERFVLLTIDWDYPFPLAAETLAFFYRSSKIFFHSAPQERRCRTAAYAWAGGMPVVANDEVASTLPPQWHREPFLFRFEDPADMPRALVAALKGWSAADPAWPAVRNEFSADASALRLDRWLAEEAARRGWGAISSRPINSNRLDLRLGRHHGLSIGGNRIAFSVQDFCKALREKTDAEMRDATALKDPEEALAITETAPAKFGVLKRLFQ